MRFATLVGLVLASTVVAQEPAKPSLSENYKARPFHELQQRVGGQWRAMWNTATNTPRVVYGTGIALEGWRENTLVEARRHAEQALVTYGDLLHLGDSTYREVIGSRMGRSWTFQFDQFYRGLPCIGGRADVCINGKGVIATLGSTAWPIPADFDTAPTIDSLEAEARAWLALDQRHEDIAQPGPKAAPRLVIWGDVIAAETAPIHLAWEVAVSNVDFTGQGPIGRYYIDAHTGAVLHYRNDKHECGFAACRHPHHGALRAEEAAPPAQPPLPVPTTVTVMGWSRTPTLSAVGPLTNVPLRGLEVNVPGIGLRTTDQNGQFTIDITSPVTITVSSLDGRHCLAIADTSSSLPSASVTVNPGVPATLQISSSGATQEEATHAGTYWWVDEANEWCRSILGNSAEMNGADNVQPRVNVVAINQTTGAQIFCNAFYTGNSINFYPQGGGCNNTGFSSVVVHEWGHGLDDRYGGISNASGDGLSEGWGDILGMYLGDNAIVGIDFRTNGGFVRTGTNTTTYPPPAEVHAAGQCWMGFAWDVRQNLRAVFGTPLAISISEDIVIGSIAANAQNQPDAVAAVFVADDDDGNLQNGTPHYAQLSAAAIGRNLPFPQIQPVAISHTDLGDTTARYKSRLVIADGTPTDTGTVTQMRLVYSAAGGPQQTKVMRPTGALDEYRGVLPGISSGLVQYHIEGTSTTGSSRYPETGEISYLVLTPPTSPPTATIFTEDFESGAPGWTHQQIRTQDDWQLGAPAGRSGTSQGVAWADPASAFSGSNIYANDLGGAGFNGSYAANVENVLRSPVINCAGLNGITLRFQRWLTVEEGIFDQATIACNGVLVFANPLNGNLVDTSWQQFEYRLPMADNNPNVQIEWRLVTDGGLQLGGWNIDDVEVFAATVPEPAASLNFQPAQSATAESVSLAIRTGPSRLFVLVAGDTQGPTGAPGFPSVQVGGGLGFLVGVTDGSGFYGYSFPSFTGMPSDGVLLYTQVVVFEPGGTFSVSNQHLNLFTP